MRQPYRMMRLTALATGFLNTELGRHAAIAVVLIAASMSVSSGSYWHANHLASRWIASLQADEPSKQAVSTSFCMPPGQPPSGSTRRLESDAREVQGRIQHHLEVMIYFYANYYRAIIMSSLLGAVSGVCIFYIANKGWTNASNYVITTFVISTVIGAFFFSSIALYKQQDNIAANKTLYLGNISLRNRILTYCATGTSYAIADKTPDAFVHRVDDEMAALNDVAIALDATQITDYGALLKQQVNATPRIAPALPESAK